MILAMLVFLHHLKIYQLQVMHILMKNTLLTISNLGKLCSTYCYNWVIVN